MEGPQRRDINELLTHGYFKTSRAKSPSGLTGTSSNAPSFLRSLDHERPRSRSRNRVPRGPPPPPPFVEDEDTSLDRESLASPRPCYDPPLRGKIDQNPILLEGDITTAEAARLQSITPSRETDDSGERRFVLIPKSDKDDPNDEDEIVHRKEEIRSNKAAKHEAQQPVRQETRSEAVRHTSQRQESRREERDTRPRESSRKTEKESRPIIHHESRREEEPRRRLGREDSRPIVHQESQRKEERKDTARPSIARQRSRQDLPSLETKVPRELPPQFRRSTSASASLPKDKDETPKAMSPRGSATEYFLSPDVARKDTSASAASRQQVHDLLWGKSGTSTEKRNSGSISRPGTPNSEKRNSGNFEGARSSNEKLTRSQQLSGESGPQKDRHLSTDQSGRTSRSSTHRGYYSSSEDDIAPDSDVEKHRQKHRPHQEHSHLRSPSRTNSRPLDPRPSSKLNSPNASPSRVLRGDEFERRETFPRERRPSSRPVSPHSTDRETPRPDRLNAFEPSTRSKSRQPSAVPSKTTPLAHHASLPIPIPSPINVSSEFKKSVPQYDESRLHGPRPQPQASSWQPPPFQPPSQNLDKPVGSYRRYSEDIESGSIMPLPSCPRTTYTAGRNDWITLREFPSFDICPSCFNSTIAKTEYSRFFMPANRSSPPMEILCDFGSSPWYRIAWLLTLKEKRRDLELFYGLARIAGQTPPCLGKRDAVQDWHSIIDPKTGRVIPGFDACLRCVRSVETLLPAIRGVFVQSPIYNAEDGIRVCDLRFDSKRFVQYFDALETAAERANRERSIPDTRNLVALANRLAILEECKQDIDLFDRRWHIITQLPEFTVCEECFDEVVWPELEEQKAIPMMFNKNLQRLPRASCQLYSPRMRGIFRLASDSGDYKMLASKARDRKTRELTYKLGMAELRRLKGDPSAEREMVRLEDDWRRFE